MLIFALVYTDTLVTLRQFTTGRNFTFFDNTAIMNQSPNRLSVNLDADLIKTFRYCLTTHKKAYVILINYHILCSQITFFNKKNDVPAGTSFLMYFSMLPLQFLQ